MRYPLTLVSFWVNHNQFTNTTYNLEGVNLLHVIFCYVLVEMLKFYFFFHKIKKQKKFFIFYRGRLKSRI